MFPVAQRNKGQRVVGLDLRGQFSDVAVQAAELIVTRAVLAVLCTNLLVAERFDLREGFFERDRHLVVSGPLLRKLPRRRPRYKA